MTCLTNGGGIGADCNGYPANAFRYDTPTWAGFSVSTSYGEDDMWDVAVKYAADWNSVKFSAAAGYTQVTDEGCSRLRRPGAGLHQRRGGRRWRRAIPELSQDTDLFQVGASIMHVPSGLFVYGLYQNEQNDGTPVGKSLNFNTGKACRQHSQRDRRVVREGRYQESLDRQLAPPCSSASGASITICFPASAAMPAHQVRWRQHICATSLPIGTFA